MSKFIVNGGIPLKGSVRLGGAKNASFKLMITAVLGNTESRLLNLSYIGDILVTQKTLKQLGVNITRCGERTVFIRPNGIKSYKIPQFSGEKTRGSTLFAAMLVAKNGKAFIPMPGGCSLGERPIDRHLEALKSLGVKVRCQNNWLYLEAEQLKGANFKFSKKTHTGTEAMILAAVKAKGKTIIENAALEPEIDDMIGFLNKMGARIKRAPLDKIVIEGVKQLKGAIHKIMPDRNEAVSYTVAALATKGDIVVENAREEHLKTFLHKLDEIGAKFRIADYGIRFWYEKPLRGTDIKTAPEPGFMTDWQPLWAILMTQAKGTSHVIEAVHNNRLQFTEQLVKMGAKIKLYNPEIENPDKFYEFDRACDDKNFHAAKIDGPTALKATDLTVPDLRAGAMLTIAALVAKGKSVLDGIEHIDRGYEDLDDRLRQLGARIRRAV